MGVTPVGPMPTYNFRNRKLAQGGYSEGWRYGPGDRLDPENLPFTIQNMTRPLFLPEVASRGGEVKRLCHFRSGPMQPTRVNAKPNFLLGRSCNFAGAPS